MGRHTTSPTTTTSTAQPPSLMTAREVSRILHVSTGYVYQAAREGRLPAIEFGRAVRFDPRDVAWFVEQHRLPPSPKTTPDTR